MRILKCMLLATLLFVVACSNHSTYDNTTKQIKIVVTPEGDTRTSLDAENNVVRWAEGDKIAVVENNKRLSISNEAVIDGEGKATFEVSFESNIMEKFFSYDAIYPASAIDDSAVGNDILYYTLPAVQCPTVGSFDPNADILLAERKTHIEQPLSLNLRFKRMVAIGELSVQGIGADETINSITFTVGRGIVAGKNSVSLTTSEVAEYGVAEASQSITLNFESPIAANQAAYFTCNPLTLGAGDSFTVVVVCGDKSYTRSVTLDDGRELRFARGAITHFAVNMEQQGGDDGNEDEGGDDPIAEFGEGRYLIVAEDEMMTTYKNGYFQTTNYTSTYEEGAVWEFEKSGDGELYVLKNSDGKYVFVNDSHKISLKDSQADATNFEVAKSDVEGCNTIRVENEDYYLQYRKANGTTKSRFAVYVLADETNPNLQLIPVE